VDAVITRQRRCNLASLQFRLSASVRKTHVSSNAAESIAPRVSCREWDRPQTPWPVAQQSRRRFAPSLTQPVLALPRMQLLFRAI